MTNPPAVSIELRDLTAAADLIEALRGTPPTTETAARRRARLADRLDRALFAHLITPTKEPT
ncbi:hypothetical protein QMZ92_13295 [Streptomyces sp. HNM0645]|uniref:hypothetical protein n=1 Tax=Streptomyces sp. HNM0645 TaxID=2782343 RepID=UPI0024B67683|nr:hypothetical protein [Streptomyces sp. HNM0645]MDI9885343.1 hypothetical protein [Streptomyces sp. HNM0645]